jgi:hypothetical protein
VRGGDSFANWRAMMMDSLKSFSAAPTPCKICGGAAELYGVVDFHKSCAEADGVRLRLSGVPVYYRRCATCEFLFTDAFDDWSHDQFKAHIYNEGYLTVDPSYQTARPRMRASSRAYGMPIKTKRACSTTAAAMTCFAARFAPAAFRWR